MERLDEELILDAPVVCKLLFPVSSEEERVKLVDKPKQKTNNPTNNL